MVVYFLDSDCLGNARVLLRALALIDNSSDGKRRRYFEETAQSHSVYSARRIHMDKGMQPTSETTLVILLGASEWPRWPELDASKAFSQSAEGVINYFFNT